MSPRQKPHSSTSDFKVHGTTKSDTKPSQSIRKSLFWVSNIHCASCVAYITNILSEVPSVENIDVSIMTHEVRVTHGSSVESALLVDTLIDAAFEVHHVTTYDSDGSILTEIDTTSWAQRRTGNLSYDGSYASLSTNAKEQIHGAWNRQHLATCDACRKESEQRYLDSTEIANSDPLEGQPTTSAVLTPQSEKPKPEIPSSKQSASSAIGRAVPSIADSETNSKTNQPSSPAEPETYSARISIGGMTCASCVNSVTAALQEMSGVEEVSVNLLTNSAALIFVGPRDYVDEITERVEDIGFEAVLDNVNQISQPTHRQTAHAGHDAARRHADADSPSQAASMDRTPKRTISILVNGMFCHHCPEKVMDSLSRLQNVSVNQAPTEKRPIVEITYTPAPPTMTVRSIIKTIDDAHAAFQPSVYHPPSIEERSRAMQIHERQRLLSRLVFVLAVAIPTFIIGIVFMSLVSPRNPTRRYLEQKMWSGSVTRIEWALFIMSTPVMVFGADVFHTRALKEIRALWRRGSRVPVLRRFYRFGSMNLLISAGTSVAYFSSLAILIVDALRGFKASAHGTTYFDSVVFLTLFILAGRFLEAYSKARTGDAVSALGNLRPSCALLVGDRSVEDEVSTGFTAESTVKISVDLLEVGDHVLIPHGTSPPADGVVVSDGIYQFDESSLTGESRPVPKRQGDEVFSGSVNVGKPVRVRITELGGSSMLDRIIAVVREGQSKRAPLERVADILTSHFVPVITLIAILTFVVWLALGHAGALPGDYLDSSRGGWTFWSLEFAIAVFVVACPCGLALAAPTALFVGGGLAAQHGILVKGGGEAFQEASRLEAIVFDKTGTLTEGGSLKVTEHEFLTKDPELISVSWTLARSLEENSNHPIAQAISAFCQSQATIDIVSSDVQEISGQGLKGSFQVDLDKGQSYEAVIGNERLLRSIHPLESDTFFISNLLSRFQTNGKSTAVLSIRRKSSKSSSFVPVAIFATSDTIRPEAVEVISRLQSKDVQVFMCTGDNQKTANAVAEMLGIPRSNVMADVLPAQKASFVKSIQEGSMDSAALASTKKVQQGNSARSIVAFVGDGINDAPALAAADVSIAMASGSDVAINSASFILLNSDLRTILELVVLSRRVFNRVRMNFGWAVLYNFILVPVAAGVFYPIVSGHHEKVVGGEVVNVNEHWRLSPVWAALAMALSSISVISSSLALRISWGGVKRLLKRQ
ncbi:hypothetical protein N7539_001690 [Penicillium diatomitis]|uniref:HMA domain-containing protein n=1 Tax=Penicillium diatomitis TaxID=2819901 RepID=A0A9W9XHF2_9EURO|nr:uncharacterized protein N7539_001690 [Penicillium diatomitis]KAJ5492944.1 hypothetical protein N7539_001690 [Penicillium diatomitis]